MNQAAALMTALRGLLRADRVQNNCLQTTACFELDLARTDLHRPLGVMGSHRDRMLEANPLLQPLDAPSHDVFLEILARRAWRSVVISLALSMAVLGCGIALVLVGNLTDDPNSHHGVPRRILFSYAWVFASCLLSVVAFLAYRFPCQRVQVRITFTPPCTHAQYMLQHP